jgi:hypothetical protein
VSKSKCREEVRDSGLSLRVLGAGLRFGASLRIRVTARAKGFRAKG